MFSVYIAGAPETGQSWLTLVQSRPTDAMVVGSATDLSRALSECARDVPGVLLLDDALLAAESSDALAMLSRAPYPVVLVAKSGDPAGARRALTIRAKDLLTTDNWPTELWASLEHSALPLFPRDRKLGRVVSVFSSKGGVGKTTLTVNLGVALADRLHEPVAILDLDLSFGDVAPMLKLEVSRTIHDVMMSDVDSSVLKDSMVMARDNLFVLAAPQTPDQSEDITGPALAKVIELLREDYAVVVLDMAPGYQETNVVGLDLSDTILTICTPDIVTLRTVGQALTLFREDFRYTSEKIHLVLNRTGSHTGIERSDIQSILKTSRIHELPSAGSLPVRAANLGIPFVVQEPNSPLARAIRALAETVAQAVKPETAATRTRRIGRKRR